MVSIQVIIAYPHFGQLGKFWPTSNLLYVAEWVESIYTTGIGLTQNFKLKKNIKNLNHIDLYAAIYGNSTRNIKKSKNQIKKTKQNKNETKKQRSNFDDLISQVYFVCKFELCFFLCQDL